MYRILDRDILLTERNSSVIVSVLAISNKYMLNNNKFSYFFEIVNWYKYFLVITFHGT